MMKNITQNIFRYDNKRYSFFINIYVSEKGLEEDLNIGIDMADVEEFVYESKLNDLMLRGYLVFKDPYARMDKFFNQQYVYLSLLFAKNTEKTDNGVTVDYIEDKNTIKHLFIVQNIKILERKLHTIKYKIEFISENWFKCAANLDYTNYNKDPESIFDIFKNCLLKQDLKIDNKLFDKVKTDVKINYISQQNSNLFDTVNYLFHKLYYYDTKEESMKFFLYNEFKDEYSLFNLKDNDTSTGLYQTVISFFKSNFENLIGTEPTGFGSFASPLPKTEYYRNFFDYNMYDYNYSKSYFENKRICEKTLLEYANNKIDNCNYLKKYREKFNNNLEYFNAGSFWNNNQNLYNDILIMLEETDSFILNVSGELHRKPGSFIHITLDRNMKSVDSESKVELEKMRKKYKAFEGLFTVTKIQHIIRPEVPQFRQQLVVCRNFIPKECCRGKK